MSKELYIAEVERILAALIDAGVSEDDAYDIASNEAYHGMHGRLADLADEARKRMKENR